MLMFANFVGAAVFSHNFILLSLRQPNLAHVVAKAFTAMHYTTNHIHSIRFGTQILNEFRTVK